MYIQYVNYYACICYTHIWGTLCTYNMLTPMLHVRMHPFVLYASKIQYMHCIYCMYILYASQLVYAV